MGSSNDSSNIQTVKYLSATNTRKPFLELLSSIVILIHLASALALELANIVQYDA